MSDLPKNDEQYSKLDHRPSGGGEMVSPGRKKEAAVSTSSCTVGPVSGQGRADEIPAVVRACRSAGLPVPHPTTDQLESARMAVLRARGELAVGEPFRGISIIGSSFDCRIERETTIGVAFVPLIGEHGWQRRGETRL